MATYDSFDDAPNPPVPGDVVGDWYWDDSIDAWRKGGDRRLQDVEVRGQAEFTNDIPLLPDSTPSDDKHAVRKKFVDDEIADARDYAETKASEARNNAETTAQTLANEAENNIREILFKSTSDDDIPSDVDSAGMDQALRDFANDRRDAAVSAAESYTDDEISSLDSTLRNYTDSEISNIVGPIDEDTVYDEIVKRRDEAYTYTDDEIDALDSTLRTFIQDEDSSAIDEAVIEANAYTDDQIANLEDTEAAVEEDVSELSELQYTAGYHSYAEGAPLKETGSTSGILSIWGEDTNNVITDAPSVLLSTLDLGESHGIAIGDDDSDLYVWGNDSDGQVSDAPNPSDITGDLTLVAAGRAHSVAVFNDGDTNSIIEVWGDDTYNQVSDTPDESDTLYDFVSAGEDFTVALREDGSLIAWGRDDSNQITDVPSSGSYRRIAAGAKHAVALTTEGALVAWGDNSEGQTDVSSDSVFVAIAAGAYHTLAIDNKLQLHSWGRDTENQVTDTPIDGRYVSIAAAGNYSMALDSRGEITVWGDPPTNVSSIPSSIEYVQEIYAGDAVASSTYVEQADVEDEFDLYLVGQWPLEALFSRPVKYHQGSNLTTIAPESTDPEDETSVDKRTDPASVAFAAAYNQSFPTAIYSSIFSSTKSYISSAARNSAILASQRVFLDEPNTLALGYGEENSDGSDGEDIPLASNITIKINAKEGTIWASGGLSTDGSVTDATDVTTKSYVDALSVASADGDGNSTLTLTREDGSELTQDLSHTHDYDDLPISSGDTDNWNTAYNRSITGASGDGNSTFSLSQEDGSSIEQDLSHTHTESEITDLGNYAESFNDLSGSPSDVITAGDNLDWDNNTLNVTGLAAIATSGDFTDLTGNASDAITAGTNLSWNGNTLNATEYSSSDFDHDSLSNTHNLTSDLQPEWDNITSKPDFATVATSGDYSDLSNTPEVGVYGTSTVTSNTTIDGDSNVYLVDDTGLTITLDSGAVPQGVVVYVKNTGSGDTTTIDTTSGNIDGGTDTTLDNAYDGAGFAHDGTDWFIVATT